MTHPSIIRVNELFNSKLSTKNIDKIRVALNYKCNFINETLFKDIREVLHQAGYIDIQGQLDTLFCIVDSLKHQLVKVQEITNPKVRNIFHSFRELLKQGIISFDSRIRRNILMCIYLDNSTVNFKTNFIKSIDHKELYEKVLQSLFKNILTIRDIEIKIDSADLFNQIYENSKSVMQNMNSRGITFFGIACYFWLYNKDLTPKPFLHNWSNKDLIKAIQSYPDFKTLINPEIEEILASTTNFWSVLSESSLLTGKINNINPNRRLLNEAITLILDDISRNYIKDYLKKIKLIATGTPIVLSIDNPNYFSNNLYKELVKLIQKELNNRTMKVPDKETIIEAMKYQFMISRVTDIDFSKQRKDHLILNKDNRKRLFE